ncbi:hypothetical protein CSUI_010178 [Cystoisospora suis]|uniref:Uncharacterized protein n=1 Tax=Cystoisospora suis TaxID=483139 RepID=A0A2C6KH77_9APIC|nr:hypothetical protein CSUI_010178 [Cystoisospora suis]
MGDKTGKGGVSAPAPKGRQGFENILQIRVFEESVAKELKHLKITQNYQMNPSHVLVITGPWKAEKRPRVEVSFVFLWALTEKVNLHNPHEKKVFRPEYSDTIRKIEAHVRPSIEKLNFPATSSQEVGWLVQKELTKGTCWRTDGSTTALPRPDSEQTWNAPRRTCEIVKYGETYVTLTHRNMFQKRDAPVEAVSS